VSGLFDGLLDALISIEPAGSAYLSDVAVRCSASGADARNPASALRDLLVPLHDEIDVLPSADLTRRIVLDLGATASIVPATELGIGPSFLDSAEEASTEDILDQVGEDLSRFARGLIDGIAWVTRMEPRMVTSASYPALPGISFASEQALFHLPANIVVPGRHPAFVAENLVHEGIHQLITIALTVTPMIDDLIARQRSDEPQQRPTLTIPWSAGAREHRHRNWPLDRVLHAAAVYTAVAEFRRRAAELPVDLMGPSAALPWQTWHHQAIERAGFLLDGLRQHVAATSSTATTVDAISSELATVQVR
jgi:hypothetical protein